MPYLILATKGGLVKKTALKDYDSPRSGGVIAINLREMPDGGDDELIGAELVSAEDDLLLISKKAQSIRFTATDDALRPMGRATSGVKGMSFREGDELLSMNVVRPGTFVFTATDGGYAKRTPVDEYRVQGAAASASRPPRSWRTADRSSGRWWSRRPTRFSPSRSAAV